MDSACAMRRVIVDAAPESSDREIALAYVDLAQAAALSAEKGAGDVRFERTHTHAG